MKEKMLTGYPSIDKPWLDYYTEFLLTQRVTITSIYEKLRAVWANDETPLLIIMTQTLRQEIFSGG